MNWYAMGWAWTTGSFATSGDNPAAVDRLNGLAVQFAQNGLTAVKQLDGSTENLRDWLTRFWFD